MKKVICFIILVYTLMRSTMVFAQQYTPDSNTVALYHFNEGNGSVTTDATGNGYDGALEGNAFTDGKYNSGVSLPGNTVDSGIVIGKPFPISEDAPVTLEAWVNMSNFSSASPNFIITPYYSLVLGSYGSAGYPEFARISGSDLIYIFGSTQIPTGSWVHLAGTWDGTTMRLYVNGVPQTTTIYTVPNGGNPTYQGLAHYHGGEASPNETAKMDEVRISNKARTPDEFNLPINLQLAESLNAHTNDTIFVPVNVSFPSNKSYSSAELSFGSFQNNGLSFLGIDTTSSMMNNKGWQIQLNNADTSLITASAGAQDISGSGALFNLQFVVTGSPCTFVPITITKAVFNTGTDSVATTNGGVNIKAIPVFGDVDENGQIQAYDASVILKSIVGDTALGCQALANAIVNCDTLLSAYDATLILQDVVGLVTIPHCASVIASGTLAAENIVSLGGGYFDVPLVLHNGSNILSFEGDISYHPDCDSLLGITWAPSLNSFTPFYKDHKGIAKFAGANSQEDGHAGIFATLHFWLKYPGATDTVTVRNIKWNGKSPTDLTFILDVPRTSKELPREFSLEQNYPNPFNPTTAIRFALPKSSYVTLKVFNLLGQQVSGLVNGEMQAGYHEVTWDASKMPSGMYFYRIHAGAFVETKKLLLMK